MKRSLTYIYWWQSVDLYNDLYENFGCINGFRMSDVFLWVGCLLMMSDVFFFSFFSSELPPKQPKQGFSYSKENKKKEQKKENKKKRKKETKRKVSMFQFDWLKKLANCYGQSFARLVIRQKNKKSGKARPV